MNEPSIDFTTSEANKGRLLWKAKTFLINFTTVFWKTFTIFLLRSKRALQKSLYLKTSDVLFLSYDLQLSSDLCKIKCVPEDFRCIPNTIYSCSATSKNNT
jgi:hypothetical protein